MRDILDVQTEPWGVKVTLVELKNIQLPEAMKRAMAKEAEAEREKRAKIISANGEALAATELAHASDVMMQHPIALQLRNLQTLVEISVDKNSTIVFPAPLMSAITDLVSFLTRGSGDRHRTARSRHRRRSPSPARPTERRRSPHPSPRPPAVRSRPDPGAVGARRPAKAAGLLTNRSRQYSAQK